MSGFGTFAPPDTFVAVPYKRPTGQSGVLRLLPTQVAAVGEIGPDNCAVLFKSSSDWLTINMSADAFFDVIGVTREAQP